MKTTTKCSSKGLFVWAIVCSAMLAPVATAQSAADIEALQKQINELSKQLEALKKQQATTEAAAKVSAQSVATVEKEEALGNDFRVHWKEGLRLDSNNGDYKLKIGGRLQNDFGWFSEGDDIKAAGFDSQDGTEFRRSRMYIGGTIYENLEFKSQFDYSGNDAEFRDVYVAIKNVPKIGKIKIGHYKEPFGLENYTSNNNHVFMDSSFINAFSPGYNIGVSVNNTLFNDRVAYTLGVFKETTSSNEKAVGDSAGNNFTGRITGLPVWAEGEKYIHLGLTASHKDLEGREYAPKIRVGAHLTEKLVGLVDTPPSNNAEIEADSVDLLGLEAVFVRGAFHTEAEYQSASIDGESGFADADFDAYYVQAGYFLTGEHKGYKVDSGKFDRVRPNKTFSLRENKGMGAWELVGRYSSLDLEDNGYQGGTLQDYSIGVNWYLNPNMRIMLNYVHGELEDGILGDGEDDDLDYIMARFQVTW
jgi:phosphate-selective porin OprO and OprP